MRWLTVCVCKGAWVLWLWHFTIIYSFEKRIRIDSKAIFPFSLSYADVTNSPLPPMNSALYDRIQTDSDVGFLDEHVVSQTLWKLVSKICF